MSRLRFARFPRNAGYISLAMAIVISALAATASAADGVRESTSLKFAPANASFYTSFQRNAEQWSAFANSKAYAKLLSMPALQLGLAQASAFWNDPDNAQLVAIKAMLDMRENKELIELVKDAVSNEIFFYGDSGYADVIDLVNQLNRIINGAQLEALSSGEEPATVMMRQLIAFLDKNGDKLKAPDTVIGFKLSDAKRAEKQLARLEKLLGDSLADQPDLKMRLKREKIGGAEFLSMHLDGTLIPWDSIPREELGKDAEAVEKLAERIKKMTLVISLGVRDGYFLFSIGDTSEHLAALGKGKLLADRPELAPLYKAGDKRFTSIGYVSEEFTKKAASSSAGQFDDLVNMAKQGLPLSGLDEKLQKEIIADAEALSADIKKALPQPGAAVSFTYLSSRGYEGFAYNYGDHSKVDGSKPLSILDHVGGNPILFVAAREKSSPEEYQFASKWAARGLYYFEQIALKEFDEAQRETYAKLRNEAEPLLKRIGKATSDMLLPALADGQWGVVLEAKTTSAKWHEAMPPADKPLPLFELAVVTGVSDAALLQKAFGEYYAVAQEALDKLHKALPDEVPEIKLVPPKTKKVGAASMFYYDLPEHLGLDKQIAPNAGLAKNVGVLSYSPAQTERLLTKTPTPTTGPLARRNQPLVSAMSFNFAALIDALSPWIDYGFDMAGGLQIADEGADDLGEAGLVLQADAGTMKFIKEQVAVVLDVLKCFRGGTSATYLEGKALVTQFEWQFQDLK